MLLGIPAMTHRQCAECTGDWSECVLCLESCVGEVRPLFNVDRDLSIKHGQKPTFVEVPMKYLVIAIYWLYGHSDKVVL